MALVFKYRKRRDAKRDRIAAQVLSAAVEGVVHYAALNRLLESPALKQQLTMLICEYVHGEM
ncbi:hypothetical protein NRY95_10450 [Xanthomonas campestris pv. phormiicola]|nr:hypothetical protein [Xanthomonas campestris pv. phormiicola]UYC18339.1 hypothetical protein NRY95_10450 [Xanthomonas campestris pv. phormiicola]